MNESDKTKPQSHPWWPLVLPFAIFMLMTTFEPSFGDSSNMDSIDDGQIANAMDTDDRQAASANQASLSYFFRYSLKIAAVAVVLLIFCRYYLKHFPPKISWVAVLFGLVGSVLWIGLCELQLERSVAATIGLPESWFAERAGINPANHYSGIQLVVFYAVRFSGLVLIVPIIEELFLRGFFIRYVEDYEWWKVKFHRLGWFPLLIAPMYGVLSHPLSEALAAASWFGLITWLMVKSRNLWDCVLAHAITNLVLGIYVVGFEKWHLW